MAKPTLQSELTTSGALWLLACISLWALGMARADGLLCSLMALALALLGWARWSGRQRLRGLTVQWQSPARAMVGTPLVLRGSIQQTQHQSAQDVHVHLTLPAGQSHEFQVAEIPARDTHTIEQTIHPQRRGTQEVLTYQLISDFPWKWWRHRTTQHQELRLLIVPQVRNYSYAFALGLPSLEHAAYHHQPLRSGGEWRGLREWRAGDALRYLHPAASTRSLARGQGLVVVDHDDPSSAPIHVVVMFHSFATDRTLIRAEPFERALSVLAGALRFLLHQKIPTTLLADFDAWCEYPCNKPSDWLELLDRFATIHRSSHTEWHDWQEAQKSIPPHAHLWMISDMPVAAWKRGILPREKPVHLIDISKKPRTFTQQATR